MVHMSSDTHQWNIQISGEPPPPSEIPWIWIAIGGTIAIGITLAAITLRKKPMTQRGLKDENNL